MSGAWAERAVLRLCPLPEAAARGGCPKRAAPLGPTTPHARGRGRASSTSRHRAAIRSLACVSDSPMPKRRTTWPSSARPSVPLEDTAKHAALVSCGVWPWETHSVHIACRSPCR